MGSFKSLAEQYAAREDLHTEDGEYTRTTIINAYYDGAMAAIQSIFFGRESQPSQGAVFLTNEDREWLIKHINEKNE